jgi:hypothetical protein
MYLTLTHFILTEITIITIFTIISTKNNTIADEFSDFPDANKFSGISPIINILNKRPISSTDANSAIFTPIITPSYNASIIEIKGQGVIVDNTPEVLAKIKSCEAITTATCSAFDNPAFSENCGINFDINGTDSKGKPHIGGMYISDRDKTQQTTLAQNDGGVHNPFWFFKPTVGKAARNKFAITKDQCNVVKETVECEANQSFGSPNCSQCLTSSHFSRVGPENGLIPFTIQIVGNAKISISSLNSKITLTTTKLSTDTSTTISVPSDSEGTEFTISVSPSDKIPTFIAGYIKGDTSSGPFKLDLTNLIQSDTITNSKPRIASATLADKFTAISVIPGKGKTAMNLVCIIPFSFLNMYDDSSVCENGPIITKAASATFLESDPCFNKKNKPGNYTTECLQSRFLSLGGTQNGTGFPTKEGFINRNLTREGFANLAALQTGPNGEPLNIDTIITNLSGQITKGLTGRDANGKPLSIQEWNTHSTFATGKSISTPCDATNNADGTLSKDCLSYLYNNEGAYTHIGPTYSKNYTTNTGQCKPGTSIDPLTEAGAEFAKAYNTGGIDSIKRKYDEIHTTANNNSLTNTQRTDAIKKCYNVDVNDFVSNNTTNNNLASFKARYIKLTYNRVECLNLAQLYVYSDDSDINIITPDMIVSKPSGWTQGNDYYPAKNFVDGVGNTFAHTSCYDIPWITVDLGAELPIYRVVIKNRVDCCKERILGSVLTIMDSQKTVKYTSDTIDTIGDTYTWFPTAPQVYTDLSYGAPIPPRQGVYGDNGSVSCDRYCRGIGNNSWNGELPQSWNGAKCVGFDRTSINNCYSTFSKPGAMCVCEPTGTGWA